MHKNREKNIDDVSLLILFTIILTSSSSALGDFFAFGAERENNYNIHKLYE